MSGPNRDANPLASAQITSFAEAFDADNYRPLPDDWHVLITDVRDSTQATEEGRYKAVNFIGAASIAAVKNALPDFDFPFAFGGDGATFCLPDEALAQVGGPLAHLQQLAEQEYGLSLRSGAVPIHELRSHNTDVRATRLPVTTRFSQTFFMGGGVDLADLLIKEHEDQYRLPSGPVEGSYAGLECRWDQINRTPGKVYSLLVKVLNDPAVDRYGMIVDRIEELFGPANLYNPVYEGGLKLTLNPAKLMLEAKSKPDTDNWFHLTITLMQLMMFNLAGKFFMARKTQTSETDWGRYRSDLVRNSDYQKFDDMLRITLSGSPEQMEQLENDLARWHDEGLLAYGIHENEGALITCIVDAYQQEHFHLVDGSDGGYTIAARQLKKQLAST